MIVSQECGSGDGVRPLPHSATAHPNLMSPQDRWSRSCLQVAAEQQRGAARRCPSKYPLVGSASAGCDSAAAHTVTEFLHSDRSRGPIRVRQSSIRSSYRLSQHSVLYHQPSGSCSSDNLARGQIPSI